MSGRVKRAWVKAGEMDKQLVRLYYLKRPRSIRDGLWPEEKGIHIWPYRDVNCIIVRNDLQAEVDRMVAAGLGEIMAYSVKSMSEQAGNLQGYARFSQRPLYERGYGGICTYIPAPGGITFAEVYRDGSFVYGYDTLHHGQVGVQFKDVSWHVVQVEFMVDAIIIARRLERAYRDAKNNAKRGLILQEFDRRLRLRGKQIDVQDNFGVMLNLLSGQL